MARSKISLEHSYMDKVQPSLTETQERVRQASPSWIRPFRPLFCLRLPSFLQLQSLFCFRQLSFSRLQSLFTLRSYLPLYLVLIIVLLSACGQNTPTAETSPAPSLSPPAEKAPPSPAPDQEASTTREIRHLFGVTPIDGVPDKIVSLHPWITDFMLSLELIPAAATSAGPNNGEFPWYFQDYLSSTMNLGWQIPEVNFETLLSIDPDLIIASQNHEQAYEQLDKIAPTIAIRPAENEEGIRKMRDTYRELADMLDMQDKAEEAIAQYDQKVEEARAILADSIGEEKVMFLRITDKELRYYSTKLFEVLYEDLNLQPSALIPEPVNGFEVLSPELLPEINPDHIFLLSESEDHHSSLQELSLWKQLSAVEQNHVYPVDYELWFQGFGPIANSLIIEDVLSKLVD
ncbi:ABC transporter substrate-binding protein [Paenibacillus senegalensis]|uniref:ABC transporter substrate-binding protein n=1 Tax=Paenibacillus senegalensis TaxID=1465766 RepID=UPI00028A0485|nr:ABC transporter substrate-binding protein [Paenibacillus senegalensis]